MVQGEIYPVAAAWVDQASPDTNNHGGDLVVRSQEGANRRLFLGFDLADLPDNFHAWAEIGITLHPETRSALERVMDLYQLDESFDEQTLAWNNQPGPGTWLESDTTDFATTFDFSYLWQSFPTQGLLWFRVLDQDEDDALGAENIYHGRGAAVDLRPTLDFDYTALEHRDLSSSLQVRRSASSDLPTDVRPQIQHEVDLASELDVVYIGGLVATVKPTLTPLEAHARVQGVVTRLFLEPLRDFRRITDEAGTMVTRVQDGTTRGLRRIVQLVDSAQGVAVSHGAGTVIDRLRRGDAVLFGLGGDEWEPGATVAWDGAAYVVAAVVGRERVEGELLYQEIGLRRLSVTAQGRAVGAVG